MSVYGVGGGLKKDMWAISKLLIGDFFFFLFFSQNDADLCVNLSYLKGCSSCDHIRQKVSGLCLTCTLWLFLLRKYCLRYHVPHSTPCRLEISQACVWCQASLNRYFQTSNFCTSFQRQDCAHPLCKQFKPDRRSSAISALRFFVNWRPQPTDD